MVRSRLLCIGSAVTAVVVIAGLAFMRATPPEPPEALAGRRAVERAVRQVGNIAPPQARYLETLLEEAERITAEERARPRWRRAPGRDGAAWLRTVVAARDVINDHRVHQDRSAADLENLLEATTEAIDLATRQIRETGMSRPEAAAFRRSVLALANARALLALGRDAEAAAELQLAGQQAASINEAWLALHRRFHDPTLRQQWRYWANETIRHSQESGEAVILVDKLRRRLLLYHKGELHHSFPAELGANGLRPKSHSGDRATPEGMYHVVELKDGRRTAYYKSLLINYPNQEDWERFFSQRQRGEIPRGAGIGSMIAVHGHGGERRDWTDGCIALRDDHMDVVFAYARLGTPVTIIGTYD